ncbi:MAG: thioredoxin family protein [Haloferacaceae archaeon]
MADKAEMGEASPETSSDGDAAESSDTPVSITGADDLGDLVDRNGTVLVDFYADWCGPCQAMEPVVERLAAETDATVATVDIEAAEALAHDHGVRSIPTFLVFADGEEVERFVGTQDEERLRAALE